MRSNPPAPPRSNPFKQKLARQQFDAFVKAYHDKHRDLVRPDGRQHDGNTFAMWFWRGYNGVWLPGWDDLKNTAAYSVFRAGQHVKLMEETKD